MSRINGQAWITAMVILYGLLAWFCLVMEHREENRGKPKKEKDNGGAPAGFG